MPGPTQAATAAVMRGWAWPPTRAQTRVWPRTPGRTPARQGPTLRASVASAAAARRKRASSCCSASLFEPVLAVDVLDVGVVFVLERVAAAGLELEHPDERVLGRGVGLLFEVIYR